MAEYITPRVAGDGSPDSSCHSFSQSIEQITSTGSCRFSVIASLLHDFAAMTETPSRPGKVTGRRGRKPHAKVPCDDCIARASRKESTATLELCEKCTAALQRPRGKKQQEQASTRKVRKQSHAVLDTALGIRAEPVAMPCKCQHLE